ncbi:MAG: hypothetical protein ACRDH5_08480 [bacterium]
MRPVAWDERVIAAIEDPENRARFLRFAWLVSLGMLLLGFAVILWKLR